jgi:signal transduction histidine kinase
VNSLRWRLVLGFALVALVPLALAMLLLASRIQETVRAEATRRLNETLGVVQARVRADGERLAGRLDVLSRDRGLVRLGLRAAAGDTALVTDLTTKRYLLGLDVLEWIGPGGLVVAAAHPAPADSLFSGADSERTAPDVVGVPRRTSPTPGTSIERQAGDRGLLLVARAPVRDGGAVAAMLRGAVRIDSAWLARLSGGAGIDLAVRAPDGTTGASTLGADFEPYLPVIEDPGAAGLDRATHQVRRVVIDRGTEGDTELIGIASTAGLDATVAALWVTSGLLGGFGILIALGLGFLWSRQIARPLETLAGFSARVAHGEWDQPLEMRSFDELETLARALDRMREDLARYRQRLVASERQAAWGQMARMVAHEVKNPLTPIAVSVADLKRSYEQQRPEFPQILAEAARTISEEVESLKRLLQEFSDFGRMAEPVIESFPRAEVAGDKRSLYPPQVAAKQLCVSEADVDVRLEADRAQLRQALINLVKNGLEATDEGGRVDVEFKALPKEVVITVADSGPGMDREQQARLFVPDHTTKSGGSGLGLTIVERIVTAHEGTITVASEPGRGTRFEIRLPRRGEEV